MRPDHDESTLREEAAHRWMHNTGVLTPDVVRFLTELPDSADVAERLRDLHCELSDRDLVNEMVAKAFGGDPALHGKEGGRSRIVRAALGRMVENHGLGVLRGLRDIDPVAEDAVEEARNGQKKRRVANR